MKRRITAFALILCLCLDLTACGKGGAEETVEAAKQQAGNMMEAVETAKEAAMETMETAKETAAETMETAKVTLESAMNTAVGISERAKEAAGSWTSKAASVSASAAKTSPAVIAEAQAVIQAYNEYIISSQETLTLKEFLDRKGSELEVSDLYAACHDGETEMTKEDKEAPLSEVISPKFVLTQAMGGGLKAEVLNMVVSMGPEIYDIIKEAALQKGISEEALQENGIEAAVKGNEAMVQEAVGKLVEKLLKDGSFGESLVEAGASVIGPLTVFTMKSAVNGYSLAKGEITTEDYGNLMAEDIMMTIMAIPHPAMILALLPVTKVVMLAGCMAGGIVAGAGYLLAKDAVMDIVDGGGFEAIVPEGSVKNAVSIAKDMVASMNLEERLSGLKDMVVTTAGTGLITIRAAE